MQILHLSAKNFRCFVDFQVELHSGFNLLIGGNGAGKTAVLDALKIGLGGFFQGFPGGKTYGFASTDMRLDPGPDQDGIPDMQPQAPTVLSWSGQLGGQKIKWHRKLQEQKRRTTKGGVAQLRKRAEELAGKVRQHESVDLPVFAYFGTERLWLQKRHGPKLDRKRLSRNMGYLDCLERESSWIEMRNWFSAMTVGQDLAVKHGMTGARVAAELVKAVESAVCQCVPDTEALFYWLGDLHLVRREQGRRVALSWDMLSDGVRSLALIAAQIAWRAATLNPHRGDRAAIDAEGVVLIDEVCLGLHPKWQRLVIQSLTKAFPKIQFVATTHSPQVLGSAKDARVILLQSGSAQPLMGLYGKDTNTLVTVYQGGEERDSRVQADLSAVEKLIDDDQVDQAQTRIADVERLLGADDPAIVRLRTLIRFLRPPKDGEAV